MIQYLSMVLWACKKTSTIKKLSYFVLVSGLSCFCFTLLLVCLIQCNSKYSLTKIYSSVGDTIVVFICRQNNKLYVIYNQWTVLIQWIIHNFICKQWYEWQGYVVSECCAIINNSQPWILSNSQVVYNIL